MKTNLSLQSALFLVTVFVLLSSCHNDQDLDVVPVLSESSIDKDFFVSSVQAEEIALSVAIADNFDNIETEIANARQGKKKKKKKKKIKSSKAFKDGKNRDDFYAFNY